MNNTLIEPSGGADENTVKLLNHIGSRYTGPSPGGTPKAVGDTYICRQLLPASDIEFFSGKGIAVETNKGTFYDFGSMSLNCILGQNDPWINANLASYILSGSPSYATTSAGTSLYYEVAEKISKASGMKDAVVNHKQCNGSDVTELAIVAAYKRRKKGQKYVVSFKGSYHGQNLTSYAVSDLQQANRFMVDDDVSTVFLPTPTHTQPFEGEQGLSAHDGAILEELRRVGRQAFAVIIEPVQVNNRVNICSKRFLRELKHVCAQLDVPLIFDDIQTGYGWLGTFSAAQFFGVQPAMTAVSKALTGGYGPLAALVMDREYGELLPSDTVRKTNGADMRSLVAAKAMMERLAGADQALIPHGIDDTLKDELKHGLLLSVFPQHTARIETHLRTLQAAHPHVFGDIRGAGLIWSIDVVDAKGDLDTYACTRIQKDVLERGVLIRDVRGGLLFKIPLVGRADELQKGFDIIDEYLRTAYR